MSQKIVLLNLAQILEFNITPENKSELEPLINLLRNELVGACFSFSVCHGMMTNIGLLDWWEAVLKLSANWKWINRSNDYEKFKELNMGILNQSLQNLIVLFPATIDPIFLKNEFRANKEISGLDIFVRVLNYIISHQCLLSKDFSLIDVQNHFFKKEFKLLEIQDPKGIIHKIEESETLGGHFTAKKLNQLLDETAQKNCFLLLFSYEVKHALHVWIDGNEWKVYDSNYDHDVDIKTPIHKKFNCKADAIKEIRSILKSDFVINAISFVPRQEKTFFPQGITIIDKENIDQFGLFHMAYSQTQIQFLLTKARTDKELCSAIGNALCHSITDFEQTTLMSFADQSREFLPTLYSLALQNEKVRDGLIKALNKPETTAKFTAFHQIALCSKGFYALINFASLLLKLNLDPTLARAVIVGLAISSSTGVTPLVLFFRTFLDDKEELENFYTLIKEKDSITTMMSSSIGGQPREMFEELKLKTPEFLKLVHARMSVLRKRPKNDVFFKPAPEDDFSSEMVDGKDKKKRTLS